MDNEPFFTRSGDTFLPTAASGGPWSAGSLHGRVIVGLLAFAIEERHGDPAYTPARLTVDMHRAPDMSPITIETRLVRDGRRIKVIDAEFFSGEISVARATSQLLRRTENPPGRIWSPPLWDAPKPTDVAPPESPGPTGGGMWATRQITGDFGSFGRRRIWISEVRRLVEGSPLTPFIRVAGAADIASPLAHVGEGGLAYINSDLTLYLHRQPRGEWIGFDSVNHQATDGVAIGECWIYDLEGAIGAASTCALAQPRGPQAVIA
jgi:hypothetical protein